MISTPANSAYALFPFALRGLSASIFDAYCPEKTLSVFSQYSGQYHVKSTTKHLPKNGLH